MSFNRSDYVKVKTLYEEKRHRALDICNSRRSVLSEKYPDIKETTVKLSSVGPMLFAAALQGKEGLDGRVEKIKTENLTLQTRMRELLEIHGYPGDYLDLKHECSLCNDEGNINGVMCPCMREKLVLMGYESSGIGEMASTHTFERFDLSYYPAENGIRANMEHILNRTIRYAEEFKEKGSPSLLFFGGTGLGKTHICTAISKRVIERGFNVIYISAQNMMGDYEAERFGRREASGGNPARFLSCELLVIDDLGTEMTGQFSISVIYNLINTRLKDGRATIINTNLDSKGLLQRYDERIVSRLIGEYLPYKFLGRDIRMMKLKI